MKETMRRFWKRIHLTADQRSALWRKARRIVFRVTVLLGGFLVFLLVLTASAGWYTSRSEFCRSCHIMEPYYKSWQESTHADVSCIECHFAPGLAEKVRGKMLGLVQLAKYVTRSEGPRPAAEIPDASCLRMGCHETRLLSGKVDFYGIPFDHEPHLKMLRREKKLRCTSCHSQIVQGEHISVTTSTCFLCHFKDEPFNEGVATCTRCHQIPTEEFDLGGGVRFSHQLAYKRGVDCINCHADLVRGNGEVPPERCRVCHNREDDLKKIGDHVFMHKKHVTDHKVDCLDCHLKIRHALSEHKMLQAASDCAICHPNHHREQVEMFAGTGGRLVSGPSGSMLATRVDCRSCHRLREISPTGAVLWKASAEMCSMCHDPSAVERLEKYHRQFQASLAEIEAGIRRAGEAFQPEDFTPDQAAALAEELDDLRHDLSFLQVSNGIHNIHYANTLTRALVERLSALCRELDIEAPEIELPALNGKSR